MGAATDVNRSMRTPGRSLIAVASLLAIAAACSRQVPSESPLLPPEARPSIIASAVVPTPTAAPTTTFVPLPTSPKTLAEPGGELLIACDGPPFSASLLNRPADDELAAHPAAAFFRSMNVDDAGMYEPVMEGWWMVADQMTQVWFIGRLTDEWFEYYRVDFGPEGWTSHRSGECTMWPGLAMGDLSGAIWELDSSAAPLVPSSTSVDLLVTEIECTGGAPVDDRLLRPAVIYGPESVLIIVAAVRLADAGDCPANPPTRVRVELREPLGDRTVRGWVPPPSCCG